MLPENPFYLANIGRIVNLKCSKFYIRVLPWCCWGNLILQPLGAWVFGSNNYFNSTSPWKSPSSLANIWKNPKPKTLDLKPYALNLINPFLSFVGILHKRFTKSWCQYKNLILQPYLGKVAIDLYENH